MLGFIDELSSYDNLRDEQLREYHGDKTGTSKDVVTKDIIDESVKKNYESI